MKLSTRKAETCGDTEHLELAVETRAGSNALALFAAMGPGELRPVPSGEWNEEADGVFYDAGSGPSVELNNRCDAGWRYTAIDREALLDVRKLTSDIKACRKLEKSQGDDALERVVSIQQQFREMAQPVEEHIIRLKEELAHEIELTKHALKDRIQHNLILQAAEEELEQVEQESTCHNLNKQKLENLLKWQNREVQEQVEHLQAELFALEQSVQKIADDNERCRKLLHAVRFETETERFIPKAALEQKAAEEALQRAELERKERAKAEADAEAEKALKAAQSDLQTLQGRSRRRSTQRAASP
jgi:hypothetical protein